MSLAVRYYRCEALEGHVFPAWARLGCGCTVVSLAGVVERRDLECGEPGELQRSRILSVNLERETGDLVTSSLFNARSWTRAD